MRKLFILVAALSLSALPKLASADTLTISAQIPSSTWSDLDDLDHYYMYAWRISGVDDLINKDQYVITGARIFFNDIKNWDTNPNRLYAHLLDTSKTITSGTNFLYSGTAANGLDHQLTRAQDTTTDTNNVSLMVDNWAVDSTGKYSIAKASNPNLPGALALVNDYTGNTKLGFTPSGSNMSWMVGGISDNNNTENSYSFTNTAEDYTYHFDAAQVAKLSEYIYNNANGDFAIALDPDCHFDNTNIKIYLDYELRGVVNPTGPVVPEPATMTLVGLGLAGLYTRARRRRKNESTEKS